MPKKCVGPRSRVRRLSCRVCGSGEGNKFSVAEMMYGNGPDFEYSECTHCGCLQIVDPPGDLQRFYPDDYYAYSVKRRSAIQLYLKRIRADHVLGRRTPLGWILTSFAGPPPLTRWALAPYIRRDQSILDVGSGSGSLLREMWIAGFRNLKGVDPFVPQDIPCAPGVTVQRGHLEDISDMFDCVMMHHVLEHTLDPQAMIRESARLLRPGGTLLIRTPIAGTYAWRTYGKHWVQLDAPRHLAVQSERSMRHLAERAAFSVDRVLYDSTAFQFWGSEQNRRGMPLMDRRSVHHGTTGIFSRSELRGFAAKAEVLNRTGDGDQACFYLRRH